MNPAFAKEAARFGLAAEMAAVARMAVALMAILGAVAAAMSPSVSANPASSSPAFPGSPSPLFTNALIPTPVDTPLSVPAYISDHMVLQRDRPVALHGRAEPGRRVVVRLAPEEGSGNGSGSSASGFEWTGSVAAGPEGEWEVEVPARPAGGPYGLTIASEGVRLRLEDVWFGEVWLASGQSNMEWKVDWRIMDREKAVREADRPLIRFFEVPNDVRATPSDWQGQGRWRVAGPETVGVFGGGVVFRQASERRARGSGGDFGSGLGRHAG